MIDLARAIADSQKADIDATYDPDVRIAQSPPRLCENIEAVTGTTYVAQFLSQAEVNAILQSPMARCGGNGNEGSFGTTPSQDTTHGKGLGWMR